jgi:hypothetical protein
MSWARLEDRFYTNRKVRKAWRKAPAAIGLHVMCITYCSDQLTDGFVDADFVEELVPTTRDRQRAVTALVHAGLWVEAVDGWVIHDYLDYNPTAASVLLRRREDADRKARGRRTMSGRTPDGVRDVSGRTERGLRKESDRPDPTRTQHPSLTPPRGGRKRDRDKWEDDLRAFADRLYPGVPEAVFAVKGAIGQLGDKASEPAIRKWVAQWHPDISTPGGEPA